MMALDLAKWLHNTARSLELEREPQGRKLLIVVAKVLLSLRVESVKSGGSAGQIRRYRF